MIEKYTVYLLRTNKGTLYCGQTKDLEARLEKHKSGKGAKYLQKFSSFELVYSEVYQSRSEALKREYEIKKLTKSQKEELIMSTSNIV